MIGNIKKTIFANVFRINMRESIKIIKTERHEKSFEKIEHSDNQCIIRIRGLH